MGLSPAQAGYMEGRTVEWKAENQLYDATAAGLVVSTDNWAPMSW
jgi:hypothetical protein